MLVVNQGALQIFFFTFSTLTTGEGVGNGKDSIVIEEISIKLKEDSPKDIDANFTTAKTAIQFHAEAMADICDRIRRVASSDG